MKAHRNNGIMRDQAGLSGIAFPLVLIEWVDSSRLGDGWRMLDEIEAPEPHRCISVGFVVKESKDAKILAPNLADVRSDDNKQTYGGIIIPTRSIIREQRLIGKSIIYRRGDSINQDNQQRQRRSCQPKAN